MKELIEKYVVDKFGTVTIPESEEEKKELARALFGFNLINNLDYWLSYSFDLIDNPEREKPFTRENAVSMKDRAFRTAFANLDDEVKENIKQLIVDTTTGVLFSSLVSFDQFDFGELKIKLVPKTSNGIAQEVNVTNEKEGLHEDLPEWYEAFSKYKERLMI